jgi:type IV secretion system protein TrbF
MKLLGNGDGEANPYLDARRNWNSTVDRAFNQLHVFQLLCVVCLLIALAAVGGIVYIGSQSKIQPYLIEIDKLGEAVSVGAAASIGSADPRVVRSSLASFIASARLVTPDVDAHSGFDRLGVPAATAPKFTLRTPFLAFLE